MKLHYGDLTDSTNLGQLSATAKHHNTKFLIQDFCFTFCFTFCFLNPKVKIITEVQPDEVYNLAAMSHVMVCRFFGLVS